MGFGQYAPEWGRTSMRDSFTIAPVPNMIGKPKVLKRSTFRWQRDDGSTVYRLHKTDILIHRPDGQWVLNSGGYKTVTTKDRLNAYLKGFSVYSDKGLWKVRDMQDGREAPFVDHMVVPRDLDKPAAKLATAEKKARKLTQDINAFVKKVDKLKKLPMPDNGDCWYCLFKDKQGKTMGDLGGNTEHLLSHIKDGYLHGSLLVNAMRWAGYDDQRIGFHYQFAERSDRDFFKRALRRYLRRKLGLG